MKSDSSKSPSPDLERVRLEGKAEAFDLVARNLRDQCRSWEEDDERDALLARGLLHAERRKWALRLAGFARLIDDYAAQIRRRLPPPTQPPKGFVARLLGR